MKKGHFRKVAILLVPLLWLGCGGGGDETGSSAGAGTVADRADLIGATAVTAQATEDGTATSTASQSKGLSVGKEAVSTSISCDNGQGTVSLEGDIFSFVTDPSSNIVNLTFDLTGTSNACGEERFTGTLDLAGEIEFNTSSDIATGRLKSVINGSTTRCSRIGADLGVDLTAEGSNAKSVVNGTIDGTCTDGAASCTFNNLELLSTDPDDQVRQKLCSACEIPPESCN